jgi:glucan 1,3-beta-glucosidase
LTITRKFELILTLLIVCMFVSASTIQNVKTTNSWVWVKNTVTGAYGEAVVGTDDAIYIARKTSFYRYISTDNSWTDLATPPNPDAADAFKTGTALAWDFGDYIYALYGAATSDSRRWFFRYKISSNSWETLANTPADQGEGDAITWVGLDNCIYATIGGEQRPTYFVRYDPFTNSWSEEPIDPPSGMGDGASLVWTGGDLLYALRGEFTETIPIYDFWCYNLTNAAWTVMADIPADPQNGGIGGVGDGGSLLYVGFWLTEHSNYIYALSGNQVNEIPDNRTYRYTISANMWERLDDLPFEIEYYVGCRLGYADGCIYAWQGAPSTWTCGGDDLARYELQQDSTQADIFVLSPENKSYFTEDVPLKFTANEPLSWIGYSLNSQMNVTIPGDTTIAGLNDGVYTIKVYANDTAGNMGSSAMVSFTVDTSLLESICLVVRGSDNIIYYRTYDSASSVWNDWSSLLGSTLDTPAAVVFGNQLHVIVRGMDGASLYHGFVDLLTDEFSGWSWMSGSTPSIPRLVSDENLLYLVVRGDDNRIYLRSYDLISESWGDWNAVPTGSTMDAPGAAVDGDFLHLVVRGMDNGLYHQRVYLPTLVYLGWSGIGGTTPSSPTLTRNYNSEGDDNSLYLIVRGSDDGIYLRSYDGSWDIWTKLSGGTNDAVGACVAPSLPDPQARLHVVVRGMNGAMYHGKYDLNSETFLGWNWINGETPSSPTLTNPFTPVKIYGLNFGPYIKEGQNPDLGTIIGEEQIRELMTTIKPYTNWVRTFGCSNGLEVAGRIAHELGLKIAVGAWLGPNSYANDKEIDNLIDVAEAGQADMLIVGSEVLLRGDLSESQLIAYINEVKNAIPYLPVATADVYGELLAHPEVIAAGDVVLPNFYPYWEGISIDNAMSFLHYRYNQIAEAAGDRPVIVSEAGWPSAGDQLGDAVPSADNAAFFFLNFESWAKAEGISSFYFEAFDEPWKVANEGNVGAHWGVWNDDGYLKTGMVDVFYGKTVPDNWSGDDTPGGPGEPLIEFSYAPSPW